MLAWMGGRRRLVREQKARRRIEGVFNKVSSAKNVAAPVMKRQTVPVAAAVEGLARQFGGLKTRRGSAVETPSSATIEDATANQLKQNEKEKDEEKQSQYSSSLDIIALLRKPNTATSHAEDNKMMNFITPPPRRRGAATRADTVAQVRSSTSRGSSAPRLQSKHALAAVAVDQDGKIDDDDDDDDAITPKVLIGFP